MSLNEHKNEMDYYPPDDHVFHLLNQAIEHAQHI